MVVVTARQPVQLRANGVHGAGRVTGEQLERDQRRAATGRTLVVETAGEELDLLTEAELPDRAIGGRALAVVLAAGGALDLVVPLPAQVGQFALVALGREGICLRGCLLEGQARSPFNERGAGPT